MAASGMWVRALTAPGAQGRAEPGPPVRSCRAERLKFSSHQGSFPPRPQIDLSPRLNPGGMGIPNSFPLGSEALAPRLALLDSKKVHPFS